MGVCTSSSVLGAHVTTDNLEGGGDIEDTAMIKWIANALYSSVPSVHARIGSSHPLSFLGT